MLSTLTVPNKISIVSGRQVSFAPVRLIVLMGGYTVAALNVSGW